MFIEADLVYGWGLGRILSKLVLYRIYYIDSSYIKIMMNIFVVLKIVGIWSFGVYVTLLEIYG